MALVEADSLKQISIKKIIEFSKDPPKTGYTYQQLTFSTNGQSTGTIGLTTSFNNSKPVKINLDYVMVDRGIERSQDINITAIPCNYGGERYFFKCPACDNKCFKVYLLATYFKCRQCHNLTYESNNRPPTYRNLNKVFGLAFIEDSPIYAKAKRYPTYKGRYTRNYLKTIYKLNNIDYETIISKMESMRKGL